MRPRRTSTDRKKAPDVVDDPLVDDVRIDEPEVPAPEHDFPAHAEATAGPKTIKRLGDLTTDEQNANKGTARGRALIETSMRRYGAGRSIVVDKHGKIIGGNKTAEVAMDIGIEDVEVVRTDGRKLVVVQRTDLDLDKDTAAKELAIADNRTGEVSLKWDADVLIDLKDRGVQIDEFFLPTELDKILEPEVDPSEKPESVVPDMELLPFEEYDYLLLMFRNSQDWQRACEVLSLQREAWSDGTVRKVGLGRVLDGARVIAMIVGGAER